MTENPNITVEPVSRLTVGAAGMLAVVGVLAGVWIILPSKTGLALLAIAAWFTLPGVVAAWCLYGCGRAGLGAALLVGPVWGYAASSVALLALWFGGVRGPTLLAAPVIAAVATGGLALLLAGALDPPRLSRADVVAACLLIALVPAIVGRPFSRVGEMLPEGQAYRAYFTADFVWRMAVAAELAKGSVPPHNPYYRGDRLRYYWLAHLLPAAEHRALSRRATLEQILLVNSLALDIGFVLFLYGFVRCWVGSAAAALAGCAMVLLCPSYEGIERMVYLWRGGHPLNLVRTLNIEAVTRWIYEGLPIDGLHRLLWYQPHHATGYALGLSAVLVLVQARRPARAAMFALSGTLLGLCLLLSTFSAIMLTVIAAVVGVVLTVRTRAWSALAAGAVAGAIPLVLAMAIALGLEYVDRGRGDLLAIMVNPLAVWNAPWVLFLSFGPLLIPAAIGASLAVRRGTPHLWVLGVIVLVSFLFYFFVDLRGHQLVYVGWRAGHLTFVACAALGGLAVEQILAMRGSGRTLALTAIGVIALLGAPTFAIDLYNTQDLSNRMEGAGFRWTLVLGHDELHALDWIRRRTPVSAIVQVDPFARDPGTWAYVPAFAQRRMAAGLPISMVPIDKYVDASRAVEGVYTAADAATAYERAARLRIDYLVVGTPERERHAGIDDRLRTRPDLFEPVFREGSVAIFHVQGGR